MWWLDLFSVVIYAATLMFVILFTLDLWRRWRKPEEIHILDPVARVGQEVPRMARMKRGVGYCQHTECEDYAKGVFLLNHGETFYCPRCRALGKVEKERGFYTGNTDIFKEVRVEYNYDPIHSTYREIAIVRDESLWGRNNVYTLQSPLIKTERRALKVAEAVLANLNRYRGLLSGDDIPRTTEIILSFDEPMDDFVRKLKVLAEEWEASSLVHQDPDPARAERSQES